MRGEARDRSEDDDDDDDAESSTAGLFVSFLHIPFLVTEDKITLPCMLVYRWLWKWDLPFQGRFRLFLFFFCQK